ncbi:branched-chain alpha-keto acid dehydrogenase subunit E2 [Thioclava dalianensis]|uniref:Dihydrolipoyllysine-residue acetyltransferase component of pyruvate dehydrogenase complex n=1 Tax=Thioclava dalianensis TaxID=1185766 RepID=A0A074T977_9RHOB|nr:2-oxo acid dehydrogenase subunit E2 [Thioclava dalianensis]KEP68336.1 branched-chain alpha-keto acid dehydrogenase subunit E2 [Thioclava dalianensis]SFN82668.1 pyruvate dehydrogenase E2 component (dihydrolipoamide acetyltransferase) [Thioclava dalianensis]
MSYVASPSVRSYAAQKGVDLDQLAQATGRETLAREDVDHAAGNPGTMTPAGPDHSRYWQVDHAEHGPILQEPLSRVARLTADNLSAANAMIPQVTHHDTADMRAIEALRGSLREEASARGIKLTALAFHVKALARCLREFERFNASLSPDGDTLILKDFVHIGIAVDTPHGLLVPVLRNADRLGLWEISAKISDLAKRAQARKIGPDEMGGASMTISNLGGLGGTAFTPIVNPPEVAILGLTRTAVQPIWEGEWIPVPLCPLDLSYDHRVINGADAARFVTRYSQLIADPRRLLI